MSGKSANRGSIKFGNGDSNGFAATSSSGGTNGTNGTGGTAGSSNSKRGGKTEEKYASGNQRKSVKADGSTVTHGQFAYADVIKGKRISVVKGLDIDKSSISLQLLK